MATTSVLGDPPAAVGGHHLQVVDADALLGGQREGWKVAQASYWRPGLVSPCTTRMLR